MKQDVLQNPQKALSREFMWALVGTGVLVASFAFLATQIRARVSAIGDMRTEASLEAAQTQLFSVLKKQQETVAPYYARLQDLIPRKEQIITFDQDLGRLAKELGLGFGLRIQGETPSSENSPGSFVFSMTFQGSVENVVAYLQKLRTLNYFIELPGLEAEGSGGGYALQFLGNIYTR